MACAAPGGGGDGGDQPGAAVVATASDRDPTGVSGSATAPRTDVPAAASAVRARAPDRGSRRAAKLDSLDAGFALSVASHLADVIGPRPAGSPEDAAARRYVTGLLRDAGWTVEDQPVALPQGGTSANIVAWLGTVRPVRHVVVGAHLDTVAGSPGANDNASGVGVLAAVARELADEPTGVPTVLVAFAAEEYQPSTPREHHVGSRHYARDRGGDVVAALSVDMVGNGDTTCVCWFAAGPDDLARTLIGLAPGDGFELRAAGDISDHGPFARRGVPAAFLWTGRDPRYHSPQDTAEHLRVDDIRRAGNLVLDWLRALDR